MDDNIKKLATWMGWTWGMWTPELHTWLDDDWNPYERIQDAWMLVEKLQGDGRIVEIRCESLKWACYIGPYLGGRMALADTAPASICAAVLKLIDAKEVNP